MSIVLAGILVSCSGMAVVAAVVLGVLPEGNQKLELALIGIGWVFVILGLIIRWKGSKMERELEEKKKSQR